VLQERTIVVHGAAAGPREPLGRLRDELTARAARREPAELVIGDFDLERILTADVRAGSEGYRHKPIGRDGFRYQVTLTAADPILYAGRWQTAVLSNVGDGITGREYPRRYLPEPDPGPGPEPEGRVDEGGGGWRYALPYLPNSALMINAGNHDAPVYALYRGDLGTSTLSAAGNGIIRVAPLAAGMEILVQTATLTAEAEGGMSRASYILPASRPMVIPAYSSQRWYLRSIGQGSVTLAWRSAWV
jgi:hypothetical protein